MPKYPDYQYCPCGVALPDEAGERETVVVYSCRISASGDLLKDHLYNRGFCTSCSASVLAFARSIGPTVRK